MNDLNIRQQSEIVSVDYHRCNLAVIKEPSHH